MIFSVCREYHNLKNKYFSLLKKTRKEFENKHIEKICSAKDPKIFWSTINKYRTEKYFDENPISLKNWWEFFKNSLSNLQTDNTKIITNNNTHDLLDIEISILEIVNSIKNSKSNKSPGPDEITSEFYKGFPQNWILYLHALHGWP